MSQINRLKDCSLFISLKILLMVLSSGLGLTQSFDIEMGSEITTYTNKVLHGLLKHNSTFDPFESSELISNIRSNGVLPIRPSRNVNNTTDDNNLSQRNTPLTSYIDLSKKDSDTIRLNTRSFADTGILDIDGFGQDKQLVLFNRSDNYIPISYKPNSIVINNNYVIRFFDEGPKTPMLYIDFRTSSYYNSKETN